MDIYSADRNVWSGVFSIVICISGTKIIKMNTLVIQYIVIGALLLLPVLGCGKFFKNFSKKKAVVATKLRMFINHVCS